MISEETSWTPSANLHWSTFIWYQSDPNRKGKYVPMKGVRRRRHKKVAPLPSTRINELHVSDQYVNEKEQSLLVWLNNEMEGDQSGKKEETLVSFLLVSRGQNLHNSCFYFTVVILNSLCKLYVNGRRCYIVWHHLICDPFSQKGSKVDFSIFEIFASLHSTQTAA